MNYTESDNPTHLTILGGGPAGLATAWYARQKGVRYELYEASKAFGGNCRTIRWGEFLLDTGAHRLHDKDPQITEAFRELLGEAMQEVDTPSQICRSGTYFDFPLSPLDVLGKMGPAEIMRILWENVYRLGTGGGQANNFRDYAVQRYGPTLANRFLLNYSEKLWGMPAGRLSPHIAGSRINRLDFKAFLLEWLGGKRSKNRHLDGRFYYPKYGIGMLTERLVRELDDSRLHRESKITRLYHKAGRINAIEFNNQTTLKVNELVSTLPLPLMIGLLTPEAPEELKKEAGKIRFRNLRLVVIRLDRDRFTSNASIYFPDPEVPFTRIYESKNRSAAMAPAGETAIAVEIPCNEDSFYYEEAEERVVDRVKKALLRHTDIKQEELLEAAAYRIPMAYPVLEAGIEPLLGRLREYLNGFENLQLVGRNARFQYAHLHDMFAMARRVVRDTISS